MQFRLGEPDTTTRDRTRRVQPAQRPPLRPVRLTAGTSLVQLAAGIDDHTVRTTTVNVLARAQRTARTRSGRSTGSPHSTPGLLPAPGCVWSMPTTTSGLPGLPPWPASKASTALART